MKRKLFVLVTLLSFAICNVYVVLAQKSLGCFWQSGQEVLGEGECAQGETKNSIIGIRQKHCLKHTETHEWKDCIVESGKCCDPKLKTSKPDCLGKL